MHGRVERVARADLARPHRDVRERRLVQRGDQFQAATSVGAAAARPLPGAHTGDQLAQLFRVRTGHIRAEVPPGGGLLVGHAGRRGDGPVLVAVTVQMGEFDGRALAVDADAADLVGAQHAVHDRGQRAVLEADQRGGDVLGLHVVDQPPGHGAHLAPRAEQVEQEIHLVDAVAHRRAATLGLPAAAPGHGVVRGVAVPGGLAVRDERAAEVVSVEQAAHMPGAGAEAVLEDDGGVRAGFLALLRLHGVEVGEGGHRRFLAPHPGPGAQRGDRLVAVQGRRGADGDEVGALLAQHAVQVGVAVRDTARRAERLDGLGIDVNRRDHLDLALLGEGAERGQVGAPGDGAGTDDGCPDAAPVVGSGG